MVIIWKINNSNKIRKPQNQSILNSSAEMMTRTKSGPQKEANKSTHTQTHSQSQHYFWPQKG